MEPSKFKDFATLNQTCWFGYRFAHPGHRLMYFLHCYRENFGRTMRRINKRWIKVAWMKEGALLHISKMHFSALLRAMAEADLHGIPYEFFCAEMQEQWLRSSVNWPLAPNQMYGKTYVMGVLAKWKERNEAGIYTAKCEQLRAVNYAGHPIQDAYMDYLCDAVENKGNRPFYLSRLLKDVQHLTPEHVEKRFGTDMLNRALDH